MESSNTASKGRLGGEEVIHVAFITDDQYAVITGTAITSLKTNRNKEQNYCVHIIAIDVAQENIKRFIELEDKGFGIELIEDDAKFARYNKKKDTYMSKSTYTRFYLHALLPDLDKVIYLDDDIIVQQDLAELNEIPLEDYYCIASRDMIAEIEIPSYLEKLQSNLTYYFNAGVMVLNLKKMRKDNISEKLINYIQTGLNYLGNQDAFNIVFNGNVKYASCLWNFLVTYLSEMPEKQIAEYYGIQEEMEECEILKKVKVVHLVSTPKPWDGYQYYLTDLFMKYYRQSPFRELECFNPYKIQSRGIQYLFPFQKVNKGSRVAIYGASIIGRFYFAQIQKTGHCKVIVWVDTLWETIQKVSISGKDYVINSPDEIVNNRNEIDAIIIAVKEENVYESIRNKLLSMGIEEQKMIWEYPGYYVD